MDCVGLVQETRYTHGFRGENPKETDHLEKLGAHARIILKWIKYYARMLQRGLDSPVAEGCEHGNDASRPSQKKANFLTRCVTASFPK